MEKKKKTIHLPKRDSTHKISFCPPDDEQQFHEELQKLALSTWSHDGSLKEISINNIKQCDLYNLVTFFKPSDFYHQHKQVAGFIVLITNKQNKTKRVGTQKISFTCPRMLNSKCMKNCSVATTNH